MALAKELLESGMAELDVIIRKISHAAADPPPPRNSTVVAAPALCRSSRRSCQLQ